MILVNVYDVLIVLAIAIIASCYAGHLDRMQDAQDAPKTLSEGVGEDIGS